MTIPASARSPPTAIAALAPPAETFKRGRDFAAWLGLTPLQKSTGGKQKLGATSKMGERTIRRLLIIGASAVVRQARSRGAPKGSWLAQMLARKPRMLVTVALANKMARIVWALLAKGENLQGSGRGGVSSAHDVRRRRRRTVKGRYGATVGETGSGKPVATHVLKSTRSLIWTRSANSHTGPRHRRLHQRPDRWQHPTTRPDSLRNPSCAEGGVHR